MLISFFLLTSEKAEWHQVMVFIFHLAQFDKRFGKLSFLVNFSENKQFCNFYVSKINV